MSPWDYAADPSKPYQGEFNTTRDWSALKLLTVGQLSNRKGVLPAARQLAAWAAANPDTAIDWNLLGSGALETDLRALSVPANLRIHIHGHCDPEQIRRHYRDNDALLFPTLGDEWGLVVDEALHSGLPVVGSVHAQAVTTLVVDNENGWSYDPEVRDSLTRPLSELADQTDQARHTMAAKARQSVSSRTPEASADQFVVAVNEAMRPRNHKSRSLLTPRGNSGPDSEEMKVISA